MATIPIPYAKTQLTLDIPDDRLVAVLESKAHMYDAMAGEAELETKGVIAPADSERQQIALVRAALENPIGSPRLSEMAAGKHKIVIITSDHTRPVPSRMIAPLLVDEIRQSNPDAEIIFLVATGFHRPSTQEELINKFGADFLGQIKVVMHDSRDDASMVDIGTLPSGGKIMINQLAMEADLLVAEGFIEPHFFAGFSGGRKSVLPGVVSQVTVLANHCSKFIASDRARAGILEGNPLHVDMLYAAQQAKLAFICNVVIDANKKIIRAFAGDLIKAHEVGCKFVLELASVQAQPADIVVTSNGGYPLDQNLYQTVKGMSAAEASVKQGGVIIICSACNDGHGGDSFYHWFADAPGGAREVMDKIMTIPATETVADQWEAQILARILLKAQVIVVTDQCDHQMIRDMHMMAASSLQEAMRVAEQIVGRQATVTVIPDGVAVIVRQ